MNTQTKIIVAFCAVVLIALVYMNNKINKQMDFIEKIVNIDKGQMQLISELTSSDAKQINMINQLNEDDMRMIGIIRYLSQQTNEINQGSAKKQN